MIVKTIKEMRCVASCFSCNEFLGSFASQKKQLKLCDAQHCALVAMNFWEALPLKKKTIK